MRTLLTHITMILLLVCCNTKSVARNDNSVQFDTVSTADIDSHNQSVKLNQTEWTKSFSNHRIGFLHTGDSLTQALDLLKNDFVIKFDSIQECEFCNKYEYYYLISNKKNDLLFNMYPGYKENDKDLIFRFELFDADYKSDQGIGIGNTVKDLKEKYNLTEAYFNYNVGLFLLVEGFDGGFGLDYNTYSNVKNFNFEQPTVESIPDKSVIDKIVIR